MSICFVRCTGQNNEAADFSNLHALIQDAAADIVAVAHFKYVGDGDVFVNLDVDRVVLNVFIPKGFPNGAEACADIHCPWGNNVGGPRRPDGGLLLRCDLSSAEAEYIDNFPPPTIVRTINDSSVTRLDITMPAPYTIYSFDTPVPTFSPAALLRQCLSCGRKFSSRVVSDDGALPSAEMSRDAPLVVHGRICERIFFRKRDLFSSIRQRRKSSKDSGNPILCADNCLPVPLVAQATMPQQNGGFIAAEEWWVDYGRNAVGNDEGAKAGAASYKPKPGSWLDKHQADSMSANYFKKTVRDFILQYIYEQAFGDNEPRLSLIKDNRKTLRRNRPSKPLKKTSSAHIELAQSISIANSLYPNQVDGPIEKPSEQPKRVPVVTDPKGLPSYKETLSSTERQHYEDLLLKSSFAYSWDRARYLLRHIIENLTVTIFLSSPFDGCEEERARFMEFHSPVLTSLCASKGISLSIVDMRWGITKEMSDAGRTILACMEAIDQANIFLGYFGARYGSSKLVENSQWIDNALEVVSAVEPQYAYLKNEYSDRSVTEMEWLHAFLHVDPDLPDLSDEQEDEASGRVHKQFYLRRSKPLPFFLFRSQDYDDRELTKAIKEVHRFGEVNNNDPALMMAKFRLKKFACENDESRLASKRLKERVRESIGVKTPSGIFTHGTKSDYNHGALIENYYDPQMGADIMFFCCKTLLSEALYYIESGDKFSEARGPHLSFARSRLAVFKDGAPDTIKMLREYVFSGPTDGANEIPLVITGASGGGKSSVVAHLVNELNKSSYRPVKVAENAGKSEQRREGFVLDIESISDTDKPHVFYHFVGCNAISTQLVDMLKRFYCEFSDYLQNLAFPDRLDEATSQESGLLNYRLTPIEECLNINDMWTEIFCAYIDARDKGLLKSIVVVFDAINQLVDEGYNADGDIVSELRWLPIKFPAGVKIVVSCLSECSEYNGAMMKVLNQRPIIRVVVEPLTIEQRKKLVHDWHSKYSKKVDKNLMEPVWNHPACANPMFLSFIMRQLITHGSYSTLVPCRDRLLSAQTVPELLGLVLEDAENVCTIGGCNCPELIKVVMRYTLCSREGLSSDEIVTLVRQDQRAQRHIDVIQRHAEGLAPAEDISAETTEVSSKNGRGPVSLKDSAFLETETWITIAYSLQFLLAKRKGVYNFMHDFVRQAVEARYFCHGHTFSTLEFRALEDPIMRELLREATVMKRRIHQRLSLFFQEKADFEDTTLTRVDEYPRPMREVTYHQRMAGIRPSVVVASRVRPLNARESEYHGSQTIVKMKGKQVLVLDPHTSRDNRFALDFALNSSVDKEKYPVEYACQQRVFSLCGEDAVSQTLDGFNVSVLAYGQTGSGKSYTMFGELGNPGLIPLTLKELFRRLTIRAKQDQWNWEASCTMVEVYLSDVYDLCNDRKRVFMKTEEMKSSSSLQETDVEVQTSTLKNPKHRKRVVRAKTRIQQVSLPGAVSYPVSSVADVEKLLAIGNQNRRTRATRMNDASSRSHCILAVFVRQTHKQLGTVRESKINLVDLAGSERQKKAGGDVMSDDQLVREGDRLKESISINKSLSALNACVRALSQSSVSHVPYRESTLTWLLQDSLGGNAKTVLLATVSPCVSNLSETLSTLKYATQAKAMPNDAVRSTDDSILAAEAKEMRLAETAARDKLVYLFGFSASHINLLREFYGGKSETSFQWGDPSSTTWAVQLDYWLKHVNDVTEAYRKNETCSWIVSLSSTCTDASEQRYLKVMPSETVSLEIDYVFQRLHDTCIAQLQMSIDTIRPVANLGQICRDAMRETEIFKLTAPSEPGLYMLWHRGDLQYSLDDAEKNWPRSYDGCEWWYSNFIAWIRVDQNVIPQPPGPPARYVLD